MKPSVVAAFCLGLCAGTAPAQFIAVSDGPTTNIVGGTQAGNGEFPWMVHLAIPFRTENPGAGETDVRLRHCGGTLLSPTVVLTAGHCVSETGALDQIMTIFVKQGVVDLNAPNPTVRRSNYVHRAPNFSQAFSQPAKNDWALVKLSEPIDGVPAVTLALDESLHHGVMRTVGWGRTSEIGPTSTLLLKVDVDFIDDALCSTAGPLYQAYAGDEATVCAGSWRSSGVGGCYGDSGGPLVKLGPAGDRIQVGVTSWGEGCGEPMKPTVYTEVQTFVAEICQVVESWGSRCALAVTNPGHRPTVVGTPVTHGSVSSTAQYGMAPYAWNVTGLPPGIEMFLPFNVWPFSNKRAEFIGTPTTLGSYTVTVTATDDSTPPVSSAATFVWNIIKPLPPTPGGTACPVGEYCCSPNPHGATCLTCVKNTEQCP